MSRAWATVRFSWGRRPSRDCQGGALSDDGTSLSKQDVPRRIQHRRLISLFIDAQVDETAGVRAEPVLKVYCGTKHNAASDDSDHTRQS